MTWVGSLGFGILVVIFANLVVVVVKVGWRPWGGSVRLICSSCGSRLTERLPKRVWLAQFVLWFLFCAAFLWPLPSDWQPWVAMSIAIPWSVGAERLYATSWMRRHPVGCQGGGELKPIVSGRNA